VEDVRAVEDEAVVAHLQHLRELPLVVGGDQVARARIGLAVGRGVVGDRERLLGVLGAERVLETGLPVAPERRAARALIGRVEVDEASEGAEPVAVRALLSRGQFVSALGDHGEGEVVAVVGRKRDAAPDGARHQVVDQLQDGIGRDRDERQIARVGAGLAAERQAEREPAHVVGIAVEVVDHQRRRAGHLDVLDVHVVAVVEREPVRADHRFDLVRLHVFTSFSTRQAW
jgi:hypothetical protein